MANMCDTCGYHWQEENEKYPSCHFEGPDGSAPCEIDDYETEDYDEEEEYEDD